MKKFTKKQIGDIEGGKTALVLCGYGPFGDCQSIRHRLDAARARIIELCNNLKQSKPCLPPDDEIIVAWENEIEVLEYAVVQGEKLLARELKKVASPPGDI